MPNRFIDPAGVRPDYVWQIGHKEEDDAGRGRGVTATQVVAGTRTIQQQGNLDALRFVYSGSILEKPQLVAMLDWLALCETQTIHFEDFEGDHYEVVITDFRPRRVWTARNPRDGSTRYWTYKLELTVIRVISGTYVGQPT